MSFSIPLGSDFPPPPRNGGDLIGWASRLHAALTTMYHTLALAVTGALAGNGTALLTTSLVLSSDFVIPSYAGAYVPGALEIKAGITLEIAADAILEIG
jgi:hypothetical protein